ncbi:uncharacterized protein LOC100677812 [Nasonia vitripennis]|uniref:Uncharacterized protein n=1 Tax=Nasonia vitripennis TaxID=7425 RepID=A0A7M7GCA7_NASVI|nr:uncharacterized protein LOC100677812 [Nasonia vitripennis]
MSNLLELMERLNKEEELQLADMQNRFAEQDRKYEELKKTLDFYKDETHKHTDSFMKSLDKLVSNKHTIEKALKRTENLTGLSVPQEQHSTVVDLVAKMANFVGNINNVIDAPNTTCPDAIHEDVVNIMERTENDLKVCRTEVTEIQDLLYNTKSLNRLLNDSNEEPEKLSDTILA